MIDYLRDYTSQNASTETFQHAYSSFNAKLFANSLLDLLVTLQRHAAAKGYFAPERFTERLKKITAHEFALNPDVSLGDRTS